MQLAHWLGVQLQVVPAQSDLMMMEVMHNALHVIIRVKHVNQVLVQMGQLVQTVMKLQITELSIQATKNVIVILAIMMMEAMQYVLNAHMNVPPVKHLILTV